MATTLTANVTGGAVVASNVTSTSNVSANVTVNAAAGAIVTTGDGDPQEESTDSYFSLDFTNESTVEVNHNLNKRPVVSVIDSAGDEVYGYVTYIDSNNLTVSFNNSFTGTISCN